MTTYIEIGNNPAILLDEWKRYANIATSEKDALLRTILTQAVLRVQEYADRALLPCTIEIEGDGDRAQLWQRVVSSIDSVVDAATGTDLVDRCTAYQDRVFLPYQMHYTIRYKTQPLDSEVSRLLPYVWELATAIWDGNTEEEQKVYQRIPTDYVVQ